MPIFHIMPLFLVYFNRKNVKDRKKEVFPLLAKVGKLW